MKSISLTALLLLMATVSACARGPEPQAPAPSPHPSQTASPSATIVVDTLTPSPQRIPPGSYIAFLTTGDPLLQLFNLDAISKDGTFRARLVEGVGSAPSVSPDGQSIADPQGKALIIHTLIDETHKVYQLPFEAYWVSWSPGGETFLISSPELVASFNPSTAEIETVVDCRQSAIGPYFSCGPAVWSPDGTFIALPMTLEISGPPDPRNGIYILDASCRHDDSGCFNSAAGPFPDSGAFAWSPDSRILALCDERSLPGSLVLLDTSSWSTRTAGGCGSAYSLAWQPDGTTIASGTYGTLQLFDIATSQWTTLLSDEAVEDLGFWISLPISR